MYGSYNTKHRNVDLYARHMFTKNNNRHKQWIAGFQARQTFLTIRHLYRHRAQNYFFYLFLKTTPRLLLGLILTPQKSFDHPHNLKSWVPPPKGGGGSTNLGFCFRVSYMTLIQGKEAFCNVWALSDVTTLGFWETKSLDVNRTVLFIQYWYIPLPLQTQCRCQILDFCIHQVYW